MTINTFTDKTSKIVNKLVWLIPIRSVRDKIRWKIMKDNIITRNFCYWVNYQTYKDKIKNKKTFFVRSDWYTEECVSKKAKDKIWREYSDNCVNDVDLSLGFDRLDENKYKNYVRFPCWINSCFNTIGGYFKP